MDEDDTWRDTGLTPEETEEQERQMRVDSLNVRHCKAEYDEINGVIEETARLLNEGPTPRLKELLVEAKLEKYKLRDKVDRNTREWHSNRSRFGVKPL